MQQHHLADTSASLSDKTAGSMPVHREQHALRITHLILTHSFAGSERYAVELANAQADSGHDVSIILHQRGCETRANAILQHVAANVKVYQVSGWKLWAMWQARRLLRHIKPQVAHAHLSAACRVLQGVKGVCLRVATLHICYKKQQHAKLDALIAIAPWQLESMPAALKSRTIQLDNWAKTPQLSALDKTQLRRQLGLPEQGFLVGTLGRVESTKGHDTLLAAFEQAFAQRHLADEEPAAARLSANNGMPDVHLCVVGDGKAMAKVKSLATPQVIFAGYQTQPALYLQCFDVFVSAARYEPFGLVFLEAMHAGLPIIATASQGASYLARYLPYPTVPIDDVGALAQALQRSYQEYVDQQLPKPEYPLARFDMQARVADVLAFYRTQMAEHERR